ncbi:MAG: hybrid sensor histidine kinase/response regulator, partial [Campylobacterota bacterium]|nr:hybrid sensor histidine kinase/response regulator [Campylobacterota bacterium]
LQKSYDIRVAYNGKKALSVLDKIEVDLILLDIEMPKCNGFEVAQKIRNNPKTLSIPIIFVTSYSNEEYIIRGFEVGGNDYITKPFNPKELQVRTNNHIKSWYYQKEIHQLNNELKQKIKDEVIKNEQQKRLVIEYSKNAALGEMIAAIAHQWRQPLNVMMLLFGNMLMSHIKGALDKERMEQFYKKGENLVNEMSQTIDDFSNFFKPSKQKTAFDIAQSISTVMLMIEEQFKHHNIEVALPCEGSVEIYGYPNEFKQVILNLFTNARDAIEAQNIHGVITCNIEQIDETTIIKIEDNAGGIDEALLPDKIFEPHFSTKAKGMGLGLYISKMIIEENMGGKFYAKNAQEGALFIIELPMNDTTID